MNRVFVLFAVAFGTIGAVLLVAQQQPAAGTMAQQSNGRVSRAVRHAKAQGMTEIKLPAPIVFPTGVDTVSELIRDYSLLRVAVVDSVTTNNDETLRTWYKVKILETFSLQPRTLEGDLPSNVPAQLLPLDESETLYVTTAGSIVIDGIRVVQVPSEKGLVLRKDRQYVGAFLLEDNGRLATPAAGAAALYEVNGDELKPQREDSDLSEDVRRVFGSRLSTLRQHIGLREKKLIN